MSEGKVVGLVVAGLAILVLSLMFGLPKYWVWQKEMSGRSALAEAEWTKKMLIEEAKAKLESAKFHAQSEVERAKGVAEANKIIGDSLKGNDYYLRYLWIQGLQDSDKDGKETVVYIPTEAGLPIMEANRLPAEK